MSDKRDIPAYLFQRTPPDEGDTQYETVLENGRRYKVTVRHFQGKCVVRVYEPIRTPEEHKRWLEGIDRAIRKACPGWRLSAYKGGVFHADEDGAAEVKPPP